MNINHLKSVCTVHLRTVKHGGRQLVTNGHILFIGDFMPEIPEDPKAASTREHMLALWRQALALEITPAKIGGCFGRGKELSRAIGDAFIAERYYRCFDADATWTLFNGGVAAVHENGVLVAVISPLRPFYGTVTGNPPCDNLTDAEVFAPFADEENDWYLADESLKKQLAQAELRLLNAQDDLDNAEEKLDAAKSEVNSLRRRLADPPAGAGIKELRSTESERSHEN